MGPSKNCPTLEVASPTSHQMPGYEATAQPWRTVVLPQGTLTSKFTASIFVLILHCSATVAATMTAVLTPTTGVGCRSLGQYGLRRSRYGYHVPRYHLNNPRRNLGNSYRKINHRQRLHLHSHRTPRDLLSARVRQRDAVDHVDFLQASGLISTCCCNLSVIGRGTDSYVILLYWGQLWTMEISHILATALAAVCMASHTIFLRIMSASPMDTVSVDYSLPHYLYFVLAGARLEQGISERRKIKRHQEPEDEKLEV